MSPVSGELLSVTLSIVSFPAGCENTRSIPSLLYTILPSNPSGAFISISSNCEATDAHLIISASDDGI